jgi:hypothetical protein
MAWAWMDDETLEEVWIPRASIWGEGAQCSDGVSTRSQDDSREDGTVNYHSKEPARYLHLLCAPC